MKTDSERLTGWRGSADLWIDAAYTMLLEAGVDQLKVQPLAEKLGLSRTSFYGHFDNRQSLLDALLARWKSKNTKNLVAKTESYAESITEALFNVFDCWLDQNLFDTRFDLAIRSWALGDPDLRTVVEESDKTRIDAIAAMFGRYDFAPDQARVRAYAVYYTQIGYIATMVAEDVELRIQRMPIYIETFSGIAPTQPEVARFSARHGFEVEFLPADENSSTRM